EDLEEGVVMPGGDGFAARFEVLPVIPAWSSGSKFVVHGVPAVLPEAVERPMPAFPVEDADQVAEIGLNPWNPAIAAEFRHDNPLRGDPVALLPVPYGPEVGVQS